MDDDDTAEVDTDRSTASERVPVRGAYNITEVGDSLKVGWWDDAPVRYTWRSLKWIVGVAVAVGVPMWAVLWAPIHWTVLLVLAVAFAFVAAKAFTWYVDVAHKYAELRLKRQQVRHR